MRCRCPPTSSVFKPLLCILNSAYVCTPFVCWDSGTDCLCHLRPIRASVYSGYNINCCSFTVPVVPRKICVHYVHPNSAWWATSLGVWCTSCKIMHTSLFFPSFMLVCWRYKRTPLLPSWLSPHRDATGDRMMHFSWVGECNCACCFCSVWAVLCSVNTYSFLWCGCLFVEQKTSLNNHVSSDASL